MSGSKKKLAQIEASHKRDTPLPSFTVGDTVRVHYLIKEGDKHRVQVFQGVVIRKHARTALSATFTVRKMSYGVGVERTFPAHSPLIQKLEVGAHGRVRRARLYYLRGRTGKAARIRERGAGGAREALEAGPEEQPGGEEPQGQAEE